MSDLDREIMSLLIKCKDSLERIERVLEPLFEKYSTPISLMPPLPVGRLDCPICQGFGYKQFIDEQTDCWTTKKCECSDV
jgi:hypothetical protein